MENKENDANDNHPPKFMLPSISNLPNPSPLFQQMNNHESADTILRGSFVQVNFPNQTPLSARSPPTQPFEGFIKQETKPSTPKFYLPNPSTTYDPMNTSYTTTYWPTYYSDYPYQSSKDINGSTGPPYNVSTWYSSDNILMYNNNRQECLGSPIPIRPFSPYYNENDNNNRHLPPLAPNYHSVINSSPSSHHLSRNSAFTNIQRRKSRDDQTLIKFENDVLEGNNSFSETEDIKVQRVSIKSDHPFPQENIDSVLLDFQLEGTVKREDYDETPKTEGGKDKKKGRSNWSRKETRSLISAVKSKYKLLLAAQRNAEKSRIWSDMFSDHCTRYSGRTLKAFKLRWARLVADYNSVRECIQTGVEPMDFDFCDEMKEILGDEVVENNNITASSDLTEESSIPRLKRKFDDEDEKVAETSQIEIPGEDSQGQSLVPKSSPLHSPSPPRFDELNNDEEISQSKKIRVDEEVKIVLKEVEDTQRKCKKIIEQLKDIAK